MTTSPTTAATRRTTSGSASTTTALATVGITDFAAQELGDIVFVDAASRRDRTSTPRRRSGPSRPSRRCPTCSCPSSGTVEAVNDDLDANAAARSTTTRTGRAGWCASRSTTPPTSTRCSTPTPTLPTRGEGRIGGKRKTGNGDTQTTAALSSLQRSPVRRYPLSVPDAPDDPHPRLRLASTRSSSRGACARPGVYCRDPPGTRPPEAIARLAADGADPLGRPELGLRRGRARTRPAPARAPRPTATPVPVLGICYGLQVMAHALGGEVERGARREYGRAHLTRGQEPSALFAGVAGRRRRVDEPRRPRHAAARRLPHARHHGQRAHRGRRATTTRPLYGVQFHPEVAHTQHGAAAARELRPQRLRRAAATGRRASFVEEQIARDPRAGRATDDVILRRSPAASTRPWPPCCCTGRIGDQLTCVFVDNGLLRARRARGGAARPSASTSASTSRSSTPRTLFLERARGRRRTPSRSARSSGARSSRCSREPRRDDGRAAPSSSRRARSTPT